MLKAVTKDKKIILGLDKDNERRLRAKDPILIRGESLGIEYDIMLCYGDTLKEVADQFGILMPTESLIPH